jgi:hypothetical protein
MLAHNLHFLYFAGRLMLRPRVVVRGGGGEGDDAAASLLAPPNAPPPRRDFLTAPREVVWEALFALSQTF